MRRWRRTDNRESLRIGKRPKPSYRCNIADLVRRLQLFRTRLSAVWSSSAWADEDYIPIAELVPLVNEGLGNDEMFGSAQAREVLDRMSEGNEVMIDEGLVYRV